MNSEVKLLSALREKGFGRSATYVRYEIRMLVPFQDKTLHTLKFGPNGDLAHSSD